MPRVLAEAPYQGAVTTLREKAESVAKTPESRAGIGYAHDLFELQQRLSRPFDAVRHTPFITGSLLENVPLPGMRGQVASISGTDLTLVDDATWQLFSVYDAANDLSNATVSAAPPNGSERSGTVQIESIASSLVSLGGGFYRRDMVLRSGSGNWTTAIAGLSVGDYLYGRNDFGPPRKRFDASGNWKGLWYGPALVLNAQFNRRSVPSSGVFANGSPQMLKIE